MLVTGASGTVGDEIVRALLARGTALRARSRDPESVDLGPEVEVVRGDLTGLASVEAALTGVDGVHCQAWMLVIRRCPPIAGARLRSTAIRW